MNVKDLLELLDQQLQNREVPLGIGKWFSWRGVYAELAFDVRPRVAVGNMRAAVESALRAGMMSGWKGGDYTILPSTPVHLESCQRDYTDGDFARRVYFLLTGEHLSADAESEEASELAIKAMITTDMDPDILTRCLSLVPTPEEVPKTISLEDSYALASFAAFMLENGNQLREGVVQFSLSPDRFFPTQFLAWFAEKGWQAAYDPEQERLQLEPRR